MSLFKPLVDFYLKEFQDKGEPVLKMISNCCVPSEVILNEYKKIIPIEDLEDKEKKELSEYAKETYPDGDTEIRLRFIKIVYTIGTIL